MTFEITLIFTKYLRNQNIILPLTSSEYREGLTFQVILSNKCLQFQDSVTKNLHGYYEDWKYKLLPHLSPEMKEQCKKLSKLNSNDFSWIPQILEKTGHLTTQNQETSQCGRAETSLPNGEATRASVTGHSKGNFNQSLGPEVYHAWRMLLDHWVGRDCILPLH